MTYTFKLSRRLSLSHHFFMWVLLALVAACNSSDLTTGPDPQSAEPRSTSFDSVKPGKGRGRRNNPPTTPTLVTLTISPDTATVGTSATARFVAAGVMSDGSKVSPKVTWSATGGTIDSTGLYTAGSAAGKYRVLAKSSSSNLADTGAVTVTAAARSVTSVTVSPASVSLQSGRTQQFSATAKLSDGSSQTTNIGYQATGGTINTSGLYTAGSAAGSFRVIASSSGKADTALVSITATAPPPPSTSAGCPVSGYTRLVNVSTPTQFNAALAAAQPGDQIRMAPGTYTYPNGAGIVANRPGTAGNRIVVCGPRSAVIRGGIVRVDEAADWWHFRGFTIDGNRAAFTGVWGNGGDWTIYDSLYISNTTQEGIIVKTGPTFSPEVRYNEIVNAGLGTALYGECIYIGNGSDPSQKVDSAYVHHNIVRHCSAEGIEIKAGANYARVQFNTIDSAGTLRSTGSDAPIEIRGSHALVTDNVIDWSNRYSIEMFADDPSGGINNTFRRNRASRALNGKMFGYGTNDGSPLSGNLWGCDNVAVAPMTLGGVTCSR